MANNGHDVTYLTSANQQNIIDSSYSVNGISVEAPTIYDVPKYLYSRDAQRQLRRIIEHNRPDIAHLHIYYGQVTPSIISILKQYEIPIVQTLHEYKLLCPVSSLVRVGEPCTLCANGSYWHAVRHRCNRGSLVRSVAGATEAYVSRWLGAWDDIDHFIAVSEFVRGTMIEHGVDEKKITTVHNFVRDDFFTTNDHQGQYFLYFGRVEEIKGLATLIRAMSGNRDIDLLVVGDGDARAQMENLAVHLGLNNVHFLGFKSGQELRDLIAGAIAVVAPSEWYEPFGLVLLESFAQSRPVVASRMGGMTEIVTEGKDGMLFKSGDVVQLTEALCWMATHREQAVEMGQAGHEKARRMFSVGNFYENLMRVYHKVISID